MNLFHRTPIRNSHERDEQLLSGCMPQRPTCAFSHPLWCTPFSHLMCHPSTLARHPSLLLCHPSPLTYYSALLCVTCPSPCCAVAIMKCFNIELSKSIHIRSIRPFFRFPHICVVIPTLIARILYSVIVLSMPREMFTRIFSRIIQRCLFWTPSKMSLQPMNDAITWFSLVIYRFCLLSLHSFHYWDSVLYIIVHRRRPAWLNEISHLSHKSGGEARNDNSRLTEAEELRNARFNQEAVLMRFILWRSVISTCYCTGDGERRRQHREGDLLWQIISSVVHGRLQSLVQIQREQRKPLTWCMILSSVLSIRPLMNWHSSLSRNIQN